MVLINRTILLKYFRPFYIARPKYVLLTRFCRLINCETHMYIFMFLCLMNMYVLSLASPRAYFCAAPPRTLLVWTGLAGNAKGRQSGWLVPSRFGLWSHAIIGSRSRNVTMRGQLTASRHAWLLPKPISPKLATNTYTKRDFLFSKIRKASLFA